ncbi:zinc finger protein 714-like isoform X2 [Bacillus rossius redtenbacheri]
MCLILDELGCSLCSDSREATARLDFEHKTKSPAAVDALPVVKEEPGDGSFALSSVIKFREVDAGHLADDASADRDPGASPDRSAARKEPLSGSGSVGEGRDHAGQVSPQRQLGDQCEDYFSGIDTNPEYGATDTLDAVLLTQDSPIAHRNKPPDKTQLRKNKPPVKLAQHIKVLPDFEHKTKSPAAVDALPVVKEEPGDGSFALSSVIKFREVDAGHLADDASADRDPGASPDRSAARKEPLSGSGSVGEGRDHAGQVSPQRQLGDQCEDYFSGIDTNPEYGATDTLDAVLLTQDSPIAHRNKPPDKTQLRKNKPPVKLAQHIKVLPGTPVKYFCTICRKTVLSRQQRNYHSFCSGDKTKPYHCMLCSKAFVTKYHYEYHIRTHAGVRPFSCEICSKGFYEKVKMIRHMMSHTGERPFECKECGKRFVEDCHLRYHLNTHSKERTYLCSFCGKQFSLALNLKRHELGHENRQVMCELCGKVFTNNYALIMHRKIHARVRSHKCPVCGRTFMYRKDLTRHHNIHTCTRRYKCSECEVAFGRKDALVRHIKGIHNDGGRNKQPSKTVEAEDGTAVLGPDSAKDKESEECKKEVENSDVTVNVMSPPHHPKSLEELLDRPSYAFEWDGEFSNELKLPKSGRVKGSKNHTTAKESEREEKKKLKPPRSRESQPIFRQIIYSNFQVNGNFKQIPVLLTQDKTVRCKEVSVINRPVTNTETPVEKSSVLQPTTHSTISQCIIHHTSALSTVATTMMPTLSTTTLSAAIPAPGTAGNSVQHSAVPSPKRRPCGERSAARPATVVPENCIRTITRLPEGLLRPLVPATGDSAREGALSGSNVIQVCGQPALSKSLHDVHWKKRSVEIAMKQTQ